MLWHTASQEDKLKLVRRLQERRLVLANNAKARRRLPKQSSTKKKMKFASDEHRRVYESLPPEARKLLFGK